MLYKSYHLLNSDHIRFFPDHVPVCAVFRGFEPHIASARVVRSYICLYVYLPGNGFAIFVKHDVIYYTRTNDGRRNFQDRLFSSGLNITELILLTSYPSY